ncbi:hypothetical protein DNAM_380 [Pseudomonas phage BroderSalsa]|nr:hypothetical protein DNAM_380 [Pseudomonas phage BroderSalsa]
MNPMIFAHLITSMADGVRAIDSVRESLKIALENNSFQLDDRQYLWDNSPAVFLNGEPRPEV